MPNYPLNHHATPMYVTVETEYLDSLHKIKTDAGIVGFDKLEKVASALASAKIKHPKFADIYCEGDNLKPTQKLLKKVRKINDNAKTHNASLILIEETNEAKEAYLLGNKEDCVMELYQVIAVVLRMIDFVEAR